MSVTAVACLVGSEAVVAERAVTGAISRACSTGLRWGIRRTLVGKSRTDSQTPRSTDASTSLLERGSPGISTVETPNQQLLFADSNGTNINGISYSLDELSRAAHVIDRRAFTAAGRSLTKHGSGQRPLNSLFPAPKGSPQAINLQAQNIVDDILTTPGNFIQNYYRGRFGNTIEVRAPDGRGIVYDAQGKFLFFKE
jgi:hypothetical protein